MTYNLGVGLMESNAINIIDRSLAMHPSLLIEALQTRAYEDSKYAATKDNPRIKQSVVASYEATMRAIDYLDHNQIERFEEDMGAGIIALNVACRLQCLPPHVRTQAAIETWPG